MRRLRILTIIVTFLAVAIAAIIPLLLPESAGSKGNDDFITQAIVTLSLSFFPLIATALFLRGLRDFKTDFKKAYYFICSGVSVQAVALLVYPTAVYFDVLGSSLTSYGGDLLYGVGALLILLGIGRFAKLLQLQNWLSNIWIVTVISASLSTILWLLPHTPVQADELYFDLTKSLIAFEGFVSLISAFLVLRIRSRASRLYSQPLAWLSAAFIFNTVGEIFYYAANHLAEPDGTPQADLASLSGIVFLISRVVLIIAGYRFIRMNQQERSHEDSAQPVDVIVGMALFASKPTEIAPMLDKLRAITAITGEKNKQLTPEQVASLRSTYFKLEEYLTTKEPLLNFTKETLRTRLEHDFGKLTFIA